MTRILVIQLCRLGDILQTTPMLRGLRRAHPRASITLMVLDGFSHVPIPSHLYDRLAVLPFAPVASCVGDDESAWGPAVERMREFVASLGTDPFDLVLNLTGTPLANLLSALLPSKEVRGGLFAPDRSRVVRHPWMTYFWSSLLARSAGFINLVDLFCRVAEVPIDGKGLEIDVPDVARTKADDWLVAHGWTGGPLVALQLGASDERKRWTPEQFAEMANRLPADLGTIVFVGAAGERPLIERAAARLTRPYASAAGQTSVVELAALLERSRLLVTNDTGTMHVAVAVGTRVLDLSTGPVYVHETGPYAVGSIAVEPAIPCFPCAAGSVCHHLSCRDDLSPGDIAQLALFVVERGEMPRPARARVLQASRTATGRLEYRPLHGSHDALKHERLRQALARMWEDSLPVASPDHGAVGFDPPLGAAGDFDEESDALALFAASAGDAARLARRIPRASSTEQAALAGELGRRLEQALTRAAIMPVLQPLAGYVRTALESAAEGGVDRVAATYAREWSAAGNRARRLAQILSSTPTARDPGP